VARALVVVAFLTALLAGCRHDSQPADEERELQAIHAAAKACRASRVHYGPHAHAKPSGLLPRTPWVRAEPKSARIDAFLFYYAGAPFEKRRDPRAYIYTNGKSPRGVATKIFWVAPREVERLTLVGERVPDGKRFMQELQSIGSGWFPSGVVVPAFGCWRLEISAGTRKAHIVFRAVPGADPS
jgi:hypothetical protein